MATACPRTRRVILSTGIAAFLGGIIAAPPPLRAADVIKANNADPLSASTSWVPGTVPGATDFGVWSNTVTGPNAVSLGADLTLGGLKIVNPAGAVTINAGNTLTLGTLGVDMSAATQNLTINAGVTLGGAQSWTVASGRSLTLGGPLSTGANQLTLSGGNFAINGVVTGSAGLTVGSAANVVLSGTNTYTGQTLIGSGSTVTAANNSALGLTGAGNEIVVSAGGTFNLGGSNLGTKVVRIQGTGVNGAGAFTSTGISQQNALQFLALTDNASVGSAGNFATTLGSATATSYGRVDLRLSAFTAGAKNLDLGGFTLTKTGGNHFGLVNADVTAGNIVVNGGLFSIEGTTQMANSGSNTITVNPGGRLGFFGLTAATSVLPIVLAGGSLGESGTTSAAQTLNAPISLTTASSELWAASANGPTLAGQITGTAGGALTELAKRGAGTIALTNTGNTFNVGVKVYQGILRADYTSPIGSGGVAPNAPLVSTDTPLGTGTTITLAGGTLAIRANLANDNTNQQFDLQRNIIVDLAPGSMTFDRVTSNTTQTDKLLVVPQLTFAAASNQNGYSIGQNQLTFTQANTHRLQLPSVTMNSDTVFTNGDFSFTGDVLSAGRNSLVRTGGSTLQFVNSGTQTFGSFFNVGTGSVRVGTGFGTPTTSPTVTLGTGPIFLGPNSATTFRTPTNIAAGQTIDVVSQRVTQATVNLELFDTLPAGLRAMGTGVLGLGSSTGFGNLDLSRLGDGTFRIGAGFAGSGAGTIIGTIAPGAGGIVRMGAGNTVTVSGTDRIAGTAGLEVGSPLINGGFAISTNNAAQNGTVLLTGANNFTGATVVNRSSVLRFQNNGSLGTGPVTVFGTLTGEQAGGVFTANGTDNNIAVTLLGGSNLSLDNSALTTNAPVNRWGDNAPLALTASGLTYSTPNNSVVSSGEVLGALTFSGGSSLTLNRTGTVLPATGESAILTFSSAARVGQGTLEIVRNGGTGANFGGGHQVYVSGPGAAPVPVNGMVSPYYILNGQTEQSQFATYGANGFVPASYSQTIRGGATAGIFDTGIAAGTDRVYVDFAAGTTTLTLGDNPIVHALKVGTGQGTTNTTTISSAGAGKDTITIRSGGLLISGDGNAGFYSTAAGTAVISPNLVFNDGAQNVEGIVNVRTGFTGVLNGVVTGSSLTKFGAGTLALSGNNAATLTGPVSVNQGVLELRGATGLTGMGGSGSLILNGGQVNVRTSASFTLTNGITLAQNIPIATVDVNRAAGDTTSSGTITFNPTAAGPGLQLLGSPGAQGQTFTLSGANYGVTIGSNAANSFAGNVTINNAVTLQLNNAPVITGTAPIITKAGAGSLVVAAVTGSSVSAPQGTQIVVNAGTLELRSLTSFGSGSAASIVMNAGTLNLRRDTTGGTYGGTGTGYNVTVNGNSTLSVDRVSAGSNIQMALGALTVNNNATFTVNNGNGYRPEFSSATLNGTAFLTSNVAPGDVNTALRITGNVSGGSLVKSGTGHLHLMATGNTYDGGTYVNQGILRARAPGALGSGPVFVNPGGILDLNSTANLNPSQQLTVRSNGAFVPMISVNTDFAHPTSNVDFSGARVGIIGLSNTGGGTYNTPIDMSALYGGNWYLGGVSTGAYDARYTADTLGAGAGNTYRFGGGGNAFVLSVDTGNNARNNLLTGPNNVVFGFDSGNILPANGTTFQFVLGGTQDYSGGSTIVNRGTVVRLTAANNGTQSGLSSSTANVFGNLILGSTASLSNGFGANVNPVTLHPGAALHFDNANGGGGGTASLAAANLTDRWGDTTPIALNGALLDLVGNNTALSSETVGDLTYSRGARLRVAVGAVASRTATGNTTLTLASLSAGSGTGNTLMIQTAAAGSLAAASSSDRIMITNAPVPVNGMLSPSIVNATDNTYVTYGANGIANVAYDKTLNATYTAGSLLATDKVDVGTAALALTDNPTVYALRTSQNINVAGASTNVTIRSGGLLLANGADNTTVTLQPNLIFNDGTSNIEAKIFTLSGTGRVHALNGSITANGITKFGAGTLVINTPQTHSSGWTVNSGVLQINDLQGLGQSVPGNGVTLNATQTTGGSITQAFGQTQLTLNRDTGSPEVATFTGGPITVVNEGIVRVAGANDRNLQIPNVTLQSTGSSRAAFTLDVPFNRVRASIPTLTLANDAIIRVLDTGATTDTGRVTAGVVGSLVGAGKNLTKIGNRTLELSGDNSSTFTGGSVTVSQGTLRVMHNGALGNAASTATIERNATLEIGISNFNSIASVTQQSGSIERWNVEDARPATYNLPAGVNLQLNTNLLGARTIGLNGGSLEGFLWTDHPAPAVDRIVGSAVTVNLLADSYVGQNILQGQGYDAGRAPTVAQPFADNVTGAFLQIDGNITGGFNLTKTGLDTVTLSGTGNTYKDTIVEMGVLRIGADNALPSSKTLVTKLGGTFDLYGHNQIVGGLGTDPFGGAGGTGVGSSGRIVNSAAFDSTLTVNATTDFSYNGVIDRNVSLRKTGSGRLTLGGTSTYVGATIIEGGTLAIGGSISGTKSIDVQKNGTLDVASLFTGLNIGAAQTLKGNGTVLGAISVEGTLAPTPGSDTLSISGALALLGNSTLFIDLGNPLTQDKVAANSVTLDGQVNLTINLGVPAAPNSSFMIVDNRGASPISGGSALFTWGGPEGLLSEGEHFLIAGQEFSITYLGGTGNDVVLTAVPEPGAAASILGGVGLLMGMRRRRRTR